MHPHLIRFVTARFQVLHPKLTPAIQPPALDSTILKQNTRVVSTSSNHRSSSPDINNRKSIPHLATAVPAVKHIAKTKLPIIVVSPALHTPIVKHCTRVKSTTSNRLNTPVHTNIHGRKIVPHLSTSNSTLVSIPKPKLPIPIAPPALDRLIIKHRTSVRGARCNKHRASARSKMDNRKLNTHLAGIIPPRRRVSNTKLSILILPPALDRAVVKKCTRK
mmetsp:Transcript_32451/g.82861  ORF Transcript_32451/g.82861 Transcript_32451/m.82861 type:complete len:219 (+) Transcript_32451:139-795(+)